MMLTTGLDTGTAFAATHAGTTFTANIVDNLNTFQSGDALVGTGAGNVLNADLGNSANFAILASTTGIQTINITAEANATGYGTSTNNLDGLPVQINALREAGVTNWGDVQSRADVVIENIQLPNGNASSDVTSAVTFTMRDTQPGVINGSGASGNASTSGPSLRAYFDPQALKKTGASSTTTVTLGAGDSAANVTAAAFAAAPLTDLPYTGFSVLRDGVAININFSAQDVANLQGKTVTLNGVTASPAAGSTPGTQADLTTAINDALTAYNTANGTNLVVASQAAGYSFFSADGVPRAVASYTVSEANHTLTVPTSNGWTAANGLPAVTASAAEIIPGTTNTVNHLITSNLILDNVGQGGFPQEQNYSGSTEGSGGDVIIGSMATSGGVQQFNVDVQRTSWIHSLQTTNDTLQVVNIVSDATASPTTGGQGLAIGAEMTTGSGAMYDWTVPGTLVATNGLTNVQTIDATGFNGSLSIGESINSTAFAKYLQNANAIVDFSIHLGNQSNGVVIPIPATSGSAAGGGSSGIDFLYAGAALNTVNLAIDPTIAASGNFRDTITGGTANDFVNLFEGSTSGQGQGPAAQNGWVAQTTQLKNVIVNVGDGNNVVEFNGSGAAQITGNAGNDTYYIDNTGGSGFSGSGGGSSAVKAAWVSNADVSATFHVTAPTAVESIIGTPGIAGQSEVSWVNIQATAATVTIEDIAVNAPTPNTSAGLDLQGVEVVYTQGATAAALATTTIAADVATVYKDYVLNHAVNTGPIPSQHNDNSVSTFGGGTITWTNAAGGAVLANDGTDVMTESLALPNGNTLDIRIGNEYNITQSAQESITALDNFTRTVVGPTTWSLSGGQAAGAPVALTSGFQPSLFGTQVAGSPLATEQQTVTWHNLSGTGATESIGGITVALTPDTAFNAVSAAQVAAAVAVGNGTYTTPTGGKLVVSGVETVFPGTAWSDVAPNPYPAIAHASGAVAIGNGITITNNGLTAANDLTAAQVQAVVASGGVAGTNGVVVNFSGQTPAELAANAATVLTYGTPNVVYTGVDPLLGSATNGTLPNNTLDTTISLDSYGNLTTSAAQGGAAFHTFTGSGETLTVTYEGVSSTVTITPSSANTAATYTSTDVNNAILNAVNHDATLNKLLHATQGSASESVIINSLIDGVHTTANTGTPTLTFSHLATSGVVTGTASGSYTATMAVADNLALSQYSTVTQAVGDGTTIQSVTLNGGNTSQVNNSTISDSGSTGGSNVIDLASSLSSANTVNLTGSGNSVITNYKVWDGVTADTIHDTINTVATHGVVLNAINDQFQMAYTTSGLLNITVANTAAWEADNTLTTTSGVYEGASLATATHVSGATTGSGFVVIENAVTNTTSVYYADDVSQIGTTTAGAYTHDHLQAQLVGVAPAAAAIHLV